MVCLSFHNKAVEAVFSDAPNTPDDGRDAKGKHGGHPPWDEQDDIPNCHGDARSDNDEDEAGDMNDKSYEDCYKTPEQTLFNRLFHPNKPCDADKGC